MTARYIPHGTRVVLQDAAGNSRWFSTRKDVDLPDEEIPQADCPMGTGRKVRTIEQGGYRLFFIDSAVRTRMGEDEKTKAENLRLHLLQYDVPHGSTGRELQDGTRFRHPSDWLAGRGIRTTESAWTVPEGFIPWDLLNTITEVGGRWRVYKFDRSEAQNLIDDCVIALREQLADAVKRAGESQQRAEEELAATPEGSDREAAAKAYLRRAKAIKKRHEKLLEDLQKSAEVFGITNVAGQFEGAQTAMDAINATMQTRAQTFAAAVQAAKAIGTPEGAAVAQQLEASSLPPEVAADWLQENGAETAGAALRAAFGAADKTEDDGTYSLVDGEDEAA